VLPIESAGTRDRVAPAVPQGIPPQAMAHGGTIIRPGAVAWGGSRDAHHGGYSTCEAIERTLADVTRDPGRFPGLIAELATARLWVPLPVRRGPFTDGSAVRLPVVSLEGTDFVPSFTSVQRLNAWTGAAGSGAMRAGDTRSGVVPHIVVPAAGLARRLPSGFGVALNPGSVPGVPLYPECVPYLARLDDLTKPAEGDQVQALVSKVTVPPQDRPPQDRTPRDRARQERAPRDLAQARTLTPVPVEPVSLAPPPGEPTALLAETSRALRGVPVAAAASRAWLSVPGHGEGLVIAVTLDDPASEPAHRDVVAALKRLVEAIPLRVPFAVDVTFPGEPIPGAPEPDVITDWMTRNTRPFYTRDLAPGQLGARATDALRRKLHGQTRT